MDDLLNYAPCGFITLTDKGIMLSINQTLLDQLDYEREQLVESHINIILSVPSRLFFQFYFFPLMHVEGKVEEMYFSIKNRHGDEIPFLINALSRTRENQRVYDCVLIPMKKRSEYEQELLLARKQADEALKEIEKYRNETKKELDLARKIQENAITDPINNNQLRMETFYKASTELSGDIYGCYQIDSSRYGIIILDVMGHGISPALITMSLQSLFQRLISKGQTTDLVMQELDQHLHDLFRHNEDNRHYCTAIYLLIDTENQMIEYTNAGHPPALWQDPSGQQTHLHSTSPPIGTFEGITFKKRLFHYSTGGRLLLYTDGVTDPLGKNHLSFLLQDSLRKPIHLFKQEIIDSLHDKENVYHSDDDQCFIIIDLL